MTRRRFPLWVVLGLVLVVALTVGSGAFDSAPPTAAQRAEAIESGIKCPSCEDLSVANSSAETAVIVRAAVRQQISQGRTDQQIKAYLAGRYGSAIVLDPPTRGLSLLVWVLPLVGGALAVGILVTVLVRRSRLAMLGPAEAARAETAVDEVATADELDDRRRFLQRSLADAYAEHQAGDLSDQDYQVLRRRDTARLAAIDLRTAGTGTESGVGAEGGEQRVGDADVAATSAAPADASPTPRPRRSRRQRLLLGGGITALGAALVLVVAFAATDRLPGQTVSGNVNLSQQAQIQQTLAQAAVLVNEGRSPQAARLYEQVLSQQSGNEVALAQLGWIEYETGVSSGSPSLVASGRAKVTQAVKLAPTDYAGRLYLGTVLLQQDKNPVAAVAQYQAFLAAKPPASLLQQAAQVLRTAYTEAGVPVPSQVPAA